ncbi:MAG: DUF5687 family protein, partial [Bacteroidota bacterium]
MWWQWIIAQQWKETVRSSVFQKKLAVNLIIGFFVLYMIVVFLLMGFGIYPILRKLFPFENPIIIFSSYLFYYLIAEVILRFYMQDVPVLSIRPYLHLPIRKSKLVHFVLVKSMRHVFNLFPLLVFVPFALNGVAPNYSGTITWSWLAAMIGLIGIANFITLYVKRQLARDSKVVLLSAIAFFGLIALEYFELISLRDLSGSTFGLILDQPVWGLVPLVLAGLAYGLNFNLLRNHAYLESSLYKPSAKAGASLDIPWLSKLGQAGELIALQLKLIWRNKRPRSVVLISMLMLLYGLIFYTN